MSIIHDLLANAVELRASDVHLKGNKEPIFRVSGDLAKSRFDVLSDQDMFAVVDDIVPEHLKHLVAEAKEIDFSHAEPGVGRFRVNIFSAQRVPSIVMRHVKTEILSIDQLQLPPQVEKLAHVHRGIVLLAGTTGSGKSTTLASMIQVINREYKKRIITVEDPIEYMFDDDQSVITQREVGLDTVSYGESLRYLLRQDPDVIMIGEMRDPTSIHTALLASETGHLVYSTVHASTAGQAIPRMLDVFPASERDSVRMAIADCLQSVICQRLIPATTGGVAPAVEILINTSTVKKLIMKNKLDVLPAAIEKGEEDGMLSFNKSVYKLIKDGRITEANGMVAATNPEALRMNLQGIFLSEGRGILGD